MGHVTDGTPHYLQRVVAGALFDLLGFLTTRPTPTAMGASEDANAPCGLLVEWAKSRCLPLDDPLVTDWTTALSDLIAESDRSDRFARYAESWNACTDARRFNVCEMDHRDAAMCDTCPRRAFLLSND